MTIQHQDDIDGHCTRTVEAGDGWSMVCPRGHAAQFEHPVIVTRGEPIVVT